VEKITTFKLGHPVLTAAYDSACPRNVCQNGVNFLRRLALQEKKLGTARVAMLLKSRTSPYMLLSVFMKRKDLQFGT
jgi:hypothetical protein